MATISKFYFHDVVTPNTDTMPSGAFYLNQDATGDATGARTARDADGTIGVLQTSATFTANADQSAQLWGWRRFVSRPLAAQTIPSGTWTHSYACAESNLNHNMSPRVLIYVWHPADSTVVGAKQTTIVGTEPTAAATEQAQILTGNTTGGIGGVSISNGDVLVFELIDSFGQGMSGSYTSTYYYDGTTESSATSSASFVSSNAPLTLATSGTTYTETGYGKESG